MARHVAVVIAEAVSGDTEAKTGSIAKTIYDLVASATAYSISTSTRGIYTVAIIIYDVA